MLLFITYMSITSYVFSDTVVVPYVHFDINDSLCGIRALYKSSIVSCHF